MFKQILLVAASFLAAFASFSLYAVNVNTADEAALRAVKGIGPAKAKAIVQERAEGGPFRDADDLGQRVKGLGGQAVERLRAEGLTIGAGRKTLPGEGGRGALQATGSHC
jgi:competence protein ComEA